MWRLRRRRKAGTRGQGETSDREEGTLEAMGKLVGKLEQPGSVESDVKSTCSVLLELLAS